MSYEPAVDPNLYVLSSYAGRADFRPATARDLESYGSGVGEGYNPDADPIFLRNGDENLERDIERLGYELASEYLRPLSEYYGNPALDTLGLYYTLYRRSGAAPYSDDILILDRGDLSSLVYVSYRPE